VVPCEHEIEVRDVTGPQDFTIRVSDQAMLEGVEEFLDWFKDRLPPRRSAATGH